MKYKGDLQITDIHSHILHGLDDGAKNREQSKKMLDIAWEQGIRKIVVTPHFMPEHRNPAKEKILEKLTQLQMYAEKKEYDIQLFPGNEIYYHEEIPELLEAGQIFTLAKSKYVLIEFSPMDDFRYIRNSLAAIQAVGFKPVLAHVERYECVCEKTLKRVVELRDMGVLIQVNMSSVEGKMGKKIQKTVLAMMKSQYVDLLGTDAHSDGSRAPYTFTCKKILRRRLPADYIENLFYKNAEMIIQDGIKNGTKY